MGATDVTVASWRLWQVYRRQYCERPVVSVTNAGVADSDHEIRLYSHSPGRDLAKMTQGVVEIVSSAPD